MTQLSRVKTIILLPCLISGSYAFAQDDQLIVTATRQAESEQDYAGAVGIIDPSRLEELSQVHPAESLNQIAGVNIHRGSGQEHLTAIRSPVLTGGAGAGSFLYLEDGVPLRAAGFANVNGLFESQSENADRLEVVKGPGSVLYGSNAIHGMINLISKVPESGGYLKLWASDDGFVGTNGSISSEKIRLSGSFTHDDGFRADSGFDQQKLQLRVDETLGDWDAVWVSSFQNLNQETAGFVQGPDAYRDETLRFTNPFPEAFRDGRSFRSYLRLEKPISETQSLRVSPYFRWTDLEFLRHFVPGQALEKNGHHSFGLQTTLYGQNFVAGVDAEYTDGFLDEFQFNPSRFSFVQGAHYDYEVRAINLAAYGQGDVALGPKTTLTGGLRIDYTDYAYDNRIDSGVFGRFQRVDDRSDDFLAVTPKLSLVHRLGDKVNIYGRAVRGARAPQTSDLYSVQINQLPGDANVETLDSVEVGLKGRWQTLSFDLAAFAMRKDNFFFRNSDGFNVTDGKTSHLGVEVSFKAELASWIEVSGDGSLARHNYEFDDIASQIVDGNRVDTAPDTLAHLRIKLKPLKRVATELEWRHMGSYFTNPGNTQSYPGHDLFVWRGSWQVADQLRLFGRVDNLFDIRYADRADFAFGNERYFPGRPRTLFLGLEKKF